MTALSRRDCLVFAFYPNAAPVLTHINHLHTLSEQDRGAPLTLLCNPFPLTHRPGTDDHSHETGILFHKEALTCSLTHQGRTVTFRPLLKRPPGPSPERRLPLRAGPTFGQRAAGGCDFTRHPRPVDFLVPTGGERLYRMGPLHTELGSSQPLQSPAARMATDSSE